MRILEKEEGIGTKGSTGLGGDHSLNARFIAIKQFN